MQLVWTERAILDLSGIEDYIAQDKPDAARRVAAHLVSTVEYLAEFPHLGKPGRRPGTRSLVSSPYIVTYRGRRDQLEILSVWHGRRKRVSRGGSRSGRRG